MKSFFRLVLLALVLLVVALVSALTAMRLAIHGHEVAVPDFAGKSPAAARMIAEQSGLELTVERQYYSPTVPEGKILSQLPPAGSQVRRGWQVRVAESLGPQRVAIPNVMGQSERVANINIRRRGLDVGAIAQMQLPDARTVRSWRKLRLRTPAASPLPKSVCWLRRLHNLKPWSCRTSSDSRWGPSRRRCRTPECAWET